jgi:hypothetical protein
MAVQIEMYDMTLFRKIQIHWVVGGDCAVRST